MRLIAGGKSGGHHLLAAYNGLSTPGNPNGANYQIGIAASPLDYPDWQTTGSASLGPNGTGWEKSWVAQPCLVWDGSQYVVYYTGYNETTALAAIGRVTASNLYSTWTRYASNPVISHGTTGDPDEKGAGFPIVHYDAADSPQWRMWYHGYPSGAGISNPAGLTVCYADSSDGLTWTKRGTVIGVGTAGAFNDIGSDNGAVIKSGSTWYVFMTGYHNPGSGTVARGGYCTTTNPASAAAYSAPTQLTNYSGTVSVGNRTWQSNQPRCIIPYGTGYLCWLSLWNPTDTSTILETCAQVSSPDLTSWLAPNNVTNGLMLPFDSWSSKSSENPYVIAS